MIPLLIAAVVTASVPRVRTADRLDVMAERAARYESAGDTNRAERIRRSMLGTIRMKSAGGRTSDDPVDAFHDFVSGRRRIELPKDMRPKDYDKVLPEQKDKTPRKR